MECCHAATMNRQIIKQSAVNYSVEFSRQLPEGSFVFHISLEFFALHRCECVFVCTVGYTKTLALAHFCF